MFLLIHWFLLFCINLLQPKRSEDKVRSKSGGSSPEDVTHTGTSQTKNMEKETRQRRESHESDTVINWKASSTEHETDYGKHITFLAWLNFLS